MINLWEQLKKDVNFDLNKEVGKRRHYHKLHLEGLLSEDVHDATVDKSVIHNPSLIDQIKQGDWEPDDGALPEKFRRSLGQSKRGEFLSQYSTSDFAKMKLFLVRDVNAGFAIKSDGDIVSVHNNSNSRGVGEELIKQAIKNGGTKLDHFDGFLHGFYSRLGFKTKNREEWNDSYAPSGWSYKPIDIFKPEYSSYAKDLQRFEGYFTDDIFQSFTTCDPKRLHGFLLTQTQIPDNLSHIVENYKGGKPSIIYQTI